MSLALKYRPRTFAEVTGQKQKVGAPLYRMAVLGTIDRPLLLAGSRGCGKTSTARILGAALNCEAEDTAADRWPCWQCPSCRAVAAGNSLDVIEVDAASNGGVDAIRKLRELMTYGFAGKWKVLLLDEAHSMSRDAFNALLKILEEPHDHTLFVLLTTEPGKILPTVTDRCMTFTFRRIPPDLIVERLTQICQGEGVTPGPGLLAAIADRADGGMRNAVMLLDQVICELGEGKLTLAAFREMFGDTDVAVPLVQAMAAGDFPGIYTALDAALDQAGEPAAVTGKLADCLADLLVLSSGGTVSAQGDRLEARRRLAARLDVGRLTRAMRALWDYQTKIRIEDRQAGLKLACVVISEQLCPARPQAPVTAAVNGANGHAPAGLDEFAKVFGAT